MEKKRAHYDLKSVLARITAEGEAAFTKTVLRGIDTLWLTFAEGFALVLSIRPAMLYKSMTTNTDSRVWQDVYFVPCPNGKTAYVKLTMREGAIVIQFKEK